MSIDYTNPEHEAVMQEGCPCSRCKAERKRRADAPKPPTYAATPRAPGAPDMCDPKPLAPWRVRAGRRAGDFIAEFERAREKHGPMASAHEGYSIILEELDELKAHVWQKQKTRDYAEMRKEVVQLGAMALAFLVEIVDTENRK